MAREIKFRIWDNDLGKFISLTNLFLLENGVVSDLNVGYVVQQNTGLKDINGVEIYEGDIIKAETKKLGFDKYIVEYFAPEFALTTIPEDLDISAHSPTHFREVRFIEVIGNIFQPNGDTSTL